MNKLKNIYHIAIVPALSSLGLYDLIRSYTKRKALILTYHGVTNKNSSNLSEINVNHVTGEEFFRHIEFVKRKYAIVPLQEIFSRMRNSKSISGLACITFDDGYFNVYKNAAPILIDYDIPAMIFIIAGLVGQPKLTWYDTVELLIRKTTSDGFQCCNKEYIFNRNTGRDGVIYKVKSELKKQPNTLRNLLVEDLITALGPVDIHGQTEYHLMDWQQIHELHNKGIYFGAHSWSHPNLSSVDANQFKTEIYNSICMISKKLTIPMDKMCFAYPDGDYNSEIVNYITGLGILGAVAVNNRLAESTNNIYTVPRITIDRNNQNKYMFDEATVGLSRLIKRIF